MSRAGEKLLSKIIDQNDPQAFIRFNVKASHFATEAERKAYRFIQDYAENNRNQSPPYDTVVEKVEGFTYEPEVGDTYDYLIGELKDGSARSDFMELLQGDITDQFNNGESGLSLVEYAKDRLDQIEKHNAVRGKVGVDVKTDVEDFLHEYRRRKAGESFKVYSSRFATINEAIGGYFSNNMYTWYGRSGRGKSALALSEVVKAAVDGAKVLIWALEMSKYEVLARIYALLSAEAKVFKTQINGDTYDAGFRNKSLLMGDLTDQFEDQFEDFLKNLNDILNGSIVVRGVDCEDFTRRDIKTLEGDIENTNADVVLVDPFYYMHMEKNTSKTTGGDAAATSMALRHLAGRAKVVLHVITQAEETKDETDGDTGQRTLRAPLRSELKKTSAIAEDAANTFGIDSLDGEAVITLGKGRNGGEGTSVQAIYIPDYGIIKEVPKTDILDEELINDEDY